jgi:predicted nuclease with TOPRIM domain
VLCKDFDIESQTLKALVKEVNNSIISIVIKNTILFEKQVATHLYQEELNNINLSYYVNNILIKEFAPHNYDNYKLILNKTMHAYHKDLSSFLDKSQKETALVDSFFCTLLDQISDLQGKSTELQKTIETHRISTITEENSNHYPPHIFKNYGAYKLFKDLIHDSIKQDEIGFYFRYMKEIENTPLIICKETVFREWYNTQKDCVIELKNPIKTYDRIGNKASKLRPYKEAREKYKELDVNRLVA